MAIIVYVLIAVYLLLSEQKKHMELQL